MGAVWPGEAGGTTPESLLSVALRHPDVGLQPGRHKFLLSRLPGLWLFSAPQETHNPHPTDLDLDPTSEGTGHNGFGQVWSGSNDVRPWRTWMALEQLWG